MSVEIQNALLKPGDVKITKIDEIALWATTDVGFKNNNIEEEIA